MMLSCSSSAISRRDRFGGLVVWRVIATYNQWLNNVATDIELVARPASDGAPTSPSVVCVVAPEEVGPLRRRLSAAPTPLAARILLLRATEGRSTRGGPPVVPAALINGGAPDLIVISDQREAIPRWVVFLVMDLVLAGASLCTLSRFLASDHPPADIPPGEGASHLLDAFVASNPGRPAKRAADLVLAGLGLLLALPALPLIAAAIRLESKGPVLFAQERLGQYRRPFRCLKFRTMCVDAERHSGPAWATADDPRITRVGRFLRRSRLDELPQLVNVLRGEMSLVGTRPIRRHFADQLVARLPFYDLRFLEPPGLTGWAQVQHRYAASFSDQVEKFSYDYYYIRNQSFWLDLHIMLRTVAVMARMKGL